MAVRLVGLSIVLGFAYGLAASPYFVVQEVHIKAPDGALAQQALARFTVPRHASVLLYPIQRIATAIEDCPQIKRVAVNRDLPSRLIVRIWRRYPVAAVETDRAWALVGEEGICVGNSPRRPSSLIRCYGLCNEPIAPGQRLSQPQFALLSETLAALDGKSLTQGLVMDFTDPHLIQIHSPSGVLGKLGGPDNLKRKILMFIAIMQQLQEKGERPAYIDVRIMDRPVWRPRVSS